MEAAGHDVHRVAILNRTAEDPDLLAQAVEGERVLITYDRDFSNLVFTLAAEPPPAIIYLRYEPSDVADVILRLMPLLDMEQLSGHITVVDRRRTRRTPFPVRSNDND